MNVPRIEFEKVFHRYRVIRERPDTLREVFARTFNHQRRTYDFVSLKGIDFKISAGEAVGLVGRNGSGKSTTLKLIAGVFQPSAGRVKISGKVAALIELGAGFHADLTGRENIVLNGLLLGLSRQEIRAREERIIEFAEIGDFIDSPVKQYSSGMYMRLGFAIASEVDPDILLMDEILAVGDAGFQQKCKERIHNFHRAGKTIIFVSHSGDAVKELCSRAILLHQGSLVIDGPPSEVFARYQEILERGEKQPVEFASL